MVDNLLIIKKPLIDQWLFLLKLGGEIGLELSIQYKTIVTINRYA